MLATLPRVAWASDPPEDSAAPGTAKDLPAGPLRVDLGAQLRLRYELQDQKTLRGYEPGARDGFLLERLLLDASARYEHDVKFALQLRDAHAYRPSDGSAGSVWLLAASRTRRHVPTQLTDDPGRASSLHAGRSATQGGRRG